MTDRRVLKWPVPVDDRPHLIGTGDIIHVDCQSPTDPSMVTVWTIEPRYVPVRQTRRVQVFGTGQPLPYFATHIGSALALRGQIVWHAFELPGQDAESETAETTEAPREVTT